MAVLTHDLVRTLAGRTGRSPVVSLYLDVDGARFVRPRDYEAHFDAMVRELDPRASAAAADDLERVAGFVKSGLDRSRTRGLAVFSGDRDGLWEVIELPVPVRNRLVVNRSPHVRQLERLLEDYERFAVLLADRQRARMLVFELGELVDKSELLDHLPRGEDEPGGRDRAGHQDQHVAAAAHQHLKRAAQVAFDVFKAQGFDHLVIAAPDEIAKELRGELHPYLQDRIADHVSIPVGARDEDIRQAALEVEQRVERAKEAALVDRLRQAVATRSGGVAGLDATLQALVERRIDTLLVSEGYEAPGWRCRQCGHLTTMGRTCPVCTAEMEQVDDVVEEAVEDALVQSCTVETCVDNADLDVLGRLGALLRY